MKIRLLMLVSFVSLFAQIASHQTAEAGELSTLQKVISRHFNVPVSWLKPYVCLTRLSIGPDHVVLMYRDAGLRAPTNRNALISVLRTCEEARRVQYGTSCYPYSYSLDCMAKAIARTK